MKSKLLLLFSFQSRPSTLLIKWCDKKLVKDQLVLTTPKSSILRWKMSSRRKISTSSSLIMERSGKRQLKNWLMDMLTLRESIMESIKMRDYSNKMRNCSRGLLKQHPLRQSFNQESLIKMCLKCKAGMIKLKQQTSKS